MIPIGQVIKPMNMTTAVTKSAEAEVYSSPSFSESGMTSAEEVHEMMSSVAKSSSFEEELNQMEQYLVGGHRI